MDCRCSLPVPCYCNFIYQGDWRIPADDGQTDDGVGGLLMEGDPNGNDPIPGGQIAGNTQDPQQNPDAQAQQTEYAYYYDKMYLVDPDSFTSQMTVLVSNIE